MNNLALDLSFGEVTNKKYSIYWGLEMYKYFNIQEYKPNGPFEEWETR